MHKISFVFICTMLLNPARGLSLAQRMFLGVLLHDSSQHVIIDSLLPDGMFYSLGLKSGDRILSMNGEAIHSVKEFRAITHSILDKDPVDLEVWMNGKQQTIHTTAKGRKQNPYKHLDVIYSALSIHLCSLRTIEYLPKRGNNFPAIFILPGYNCSSVETFSRSYYKSLIEQWVENGFVVYSVEKSGVGDSEGCIPCEETDLQNDIFIYTAALQKLKQDIQVDSNRIYLWGHSMGGILAPVIAQQVKVKGIITLGTVFRPWHQFLPDMHRIQKPLLDHWNDQQTSLFIDTIRSLYHAFFVEKKTPAELVQFPSYTHLTQTELEYEPGHTMMWGRHWRFWQQIDSLDLSKAWRSLHIPVLILQGGTDYIQCSEKEPRLILEAVNEKDPDLAKMVIIPDLDHLCMKSESYEEAVRNLEQKQYLLGNFHQGMADVILNWLRDQEGS